MEDEIRKELERIRHILASNQGASDPIKLTFAAKWLEKVFSFALDQDLLAKVLEKLVNCPASDGTHLEAIRLLLHRKGGE